MVSSPSSDQLSALGLSNHSLNSENYAEIGGSPGKKALTKIKISSDSPYCQDKLIK